MLDIGPFAVSSHVENSLDGMQEWPTFYHSSFGKIRSGKLAGAIRFTMRYD
jgi:hypothetical protein